MTAAVEFRGVDILFGGGQSGRRGREIKLAALRLLEQGCSRTEIAAETGVVVGVSNANLAVGHGEICVLMGLSGSGKSTLLRAANGLNRVTRGEVRLHDGDGSVDVASCSPAVLRRMRMQHVAMVFQQFALLPWRTVRENVGLRLELRGVAAAERRRSGGASSTRSWSWSASTNGPTASPRNSPAACSNASAWPAPSLPTPTYC